MGSSTFPAVIVSSDQIGFMNFDVFKKNGMLHPRCTIRRLITDLAKRTVRKKIQGINLNTGQISRGQEHGQVLMSRSFKTASGQEEKLIGGSVKPHNKY